MLNATFAMKLNLQVRAIATGATMLIGTATMGLACDRPDGHGFPLRPNLGERHLEDATGEPFLLHGDTAWSLIGDLTREDAELYLSDRNQRGFNTLLVSLIEYRFSRNAPANAYGDPPFLGERGFISPNPAYFDHAEWILDRACELGFVVLLTPAYAGVNGGSEGWYADMVAAGSQALHDYGRWIGARFERFDNIIWVQGGDYDPPDRDLVRAIVEGINETDADAVHTSHGAPDTRPLEYWAGDAWMAINNVYTYGDVLEASRKEAGTDPARPFFLIESAYENEHEAGAFRVRMQAYQAILSGASGHIYGNNPIWHFDGPGVFPASTTWQAELDSPGAHSMTILRDLFAAQEWWRLRPDIDGSFMVSGRGGWLRKSAIAAMADDGSFGMVYIPNRRRVTLDLDLLEGTPIVAEWMDPSTGDTTAADGSPIDASRQTFHPPGRNASGDPDWILVVTSAQSAAEVAE